MDRAVELLAQAIRQQKKVVIHGDYDVDGLTASALLVRFLQAHGLAPVVVLPDRLSEGYGLTEESVKRVLAGQPDLLVTVDCGISSHEALSQLKQAGLDVVVTDHHECPDQLPEADAVINPKRPDSRYPFAALAGVGVVWKLIEACQQAVPIHGFLQQHLDLVCLGTVGDLVPLVDENRVLVSLGLAQLNRLMTQAEPALGSSAGLWQLIRSALPEGQTVTAVPGAGLRVPIWILGSSTFGAQVAAALGLPFAFASHFAPAMLFDAIGIYRARFEPSPALAAPYVMLGVNVVAAETDDEAQFLASSGRESWASLRAGRPVTLPPPSREWAHDPFEAADPLQRTRVSFIGSAATVHRQMDEFVARTGADELIVTSHIHDHDARVRSYEIAAALMPAVTR